MLGLNVPNVLQWIGLEKAGRLIWSSLLLVGGCVAVYRMTKRPRSPEPSTWAQAVGGAVLVFGLMTLAYGTVPHEWLNYASTYLHWGESSHFFRAGVIPFDMSRRAGADAVAALIYVVFLSVQVWLSVAWQKRPAAGAVAEQEDSVPQGPTRRRLRRISAFGRPVTTEG